MIIHDYHFECKKKRAKINKPQIISTLSWSKRWHGIEFKFSIIKSKAYTLQKKNKTQEIRLI